MSQKLISKMLSGKVVYSDKAIIAVMLIVLPRWRAHRARNQDAEGADGD